MSLRDWLALGILTISLCCAAGLCCSLVLEGWRGLRRWLHARRGGTDTREGDLRNTRPRRV